jgi:cytochrome P450
MITQNNYDDVTVHRLTNALLDLWSHPQSQKAREKAKKVLNDVIELQEEVLRIQDLKKSINA